MYERMTRAELIARRAELRKELADADPDAKEGIRHQIRILEHLLQTAPE